MFPSKLWSRIKSRKELIYDSPFLKRMSQLERYEFLQLCHRRQYKAGEYVYHQGDPGTGVYLIEQGSVELLFQTQKEEEPATLTELHAPESFGAFSIDYQLRRKATARCRNDCLLYGFFISDYQVLGKRHPRIALRFLEVLHIVSVQQRDLILNRLSARQSEILEYALLFETYDLPSTDVFPEKTA